MIIIKKNHYLLVVLVKIIIHGGNAKKKQTIKLSEISAYILSCMKSEQQIDKGRQIGRGMYLHLFQAPLLMQTF